MDERDDRERGREDEATAAERAAEPEETGDAAAGADPDDAAPLVSEEGVNEGAADMVREHPGGEPASEGD